MFIYYGRHDLMTIPHEWIAIIIGSCLIIIGSDMDEAEKQRGAVDLQPIMQQVEACNHAINSHNLAYYTDPDNQCPPIGIHQVDVVTEYINTNPDAIIRIMPPPMAN